MPHSHNRDLPRLWAVWGVNPTTEQLVELVVVADDSHAACHQVERCGLLLVDAAEHHPEPEFMRAD